MFPLKSFLLPSPEVADSEAGRASSRLHSRTLGFALIVPPTKGASTCEVCLHGQILKFQADAFETWLWDFQLPAFSDELHLVPVNLVLLQQSMLNLTGLRHHNKCLS